MIGISAYTENINAVIHLTKIIKSVLPKIIIVLGGAHVTFCRKKLCIIIQLIMCAVEKEK